jgi:nicotinamidase-related amidase
MTKPIRIAPDRCCGAIIDVQSYFLGQIDKRQRSRIVTNMRNFARLLGYLRIPMIVTVERPLERKGGLPREIAAHLSEPARTFEKDFFDLTKEKAIKNYLGRLKKKQVIVAGCETDVCILQSCLGLLALGYEVFAVEELLFSSARNVDAAMVRMRAEGVVFLSYKTLFYELLESVDGGRYSEKVFRDHGPMPDDIPDVATT